MVYQPNKHDVVTATWHSTTHALRHLTTSAIEPLGYLATLPMRKSHTPHSITRHSIGHLVKYSVT